MRGGGAKLSKQTDTRDRRPGAGRGYRHRVARARAEADRWPRANRRDRQPLGRGGQHRQRNRGERAAGRLHGIDHIQHVHDQSEPLQETAVRSGARSAAGDADRFVAVSTDGASVDCREDAARADCARQNAEAHFRLRRHRQLRPSRGGALQQHGGHRVDACAIQRRRSRTDRHAGRAGEPDHEQHRLRHAVCEGRPPARARDHDAHAFAGVARAADDFGIRIARL